MRILTLIMLCAVGACLYFAAYSPIMAGGIMTSLYDIGRANLDQVAALWVFAAAVVMILIVLTAIMIASENAMLHGKVKRLDGRIVKLEDENDDYRLISLGKATQIATLQGKLDGMQSLFDSSHLRPSNGNLPARTEHNVAAE